VHRPSFRADAVWAYWSSSSYANDAGGAWIVYAGNGGNLGYGGKYEYSIAARAVRGPR
jgi:hypothetical protein